MALAKIVVTPATSSRLYDSRLYDVTVIYLTDDDQQAYGQLEQHAGMTTSFVNVPYFAIDSGLVLLNLKGVKAEQFTPKMKFTAFDIDWEIDFNFDQRKLLQCFDEISVYVIQTTASVPSLLFTRDPGKATEYNWYLPLGKHKSLLRGTHVLQMRQEQGNLGYSLNLEDRDYLSKYFLTPLDFYIPMPHEYCLLHDKDQVWLGRSSDTSTHVNRVPQSQFYTYADIPEGCRNFTLFKRGEVACPTQAGFHFNNKIYNVRSNSTQITSVELQKT